MKGEQLRKNKKSIVGQFEKKIQTKQTVGRYKPTNRHKNDLGNKFSLKFRPNILLRFWLF